MDRTLSDAELDDIEHRAARAVEVAPQPWEAWLETHHGTGGGSFVRLGANPEVDSEMYIDVRLGTNHLTSPDPRLDAVIEFIAHAAADVPRLVTEIKRLRSEHM